MIKVLPRFKILNHHKRGFLLNASTRLEKAIVFAIIAFAFFFRVMVFIQHTFPPGDDEAMNTGFVYLILEQGRIPTVNTYHMPGTPYSYPPIFHLVAGSLTFFTGLPILFVVEALGIGISALTAIPFYCFVRKLLGNGAISLTATFLFTISDADLYMLTWGGYVNLFALFFFPSIIWLAVREKPSEIRHIVTMGILTGTLFMTHHFSAFIYGIIFAVISVATYLGGKLIKKNEEWHLFSKKLLSSLIIGAVISAAWITTKIQYYLMMFGPAGTYWGIVSLPSAVTISITALAGMAAAMFFIVWFSLIGLYWIANNWGWRNYRTTLVILWIVIPAVMSTFYLFGPPDIYQRFLYYLVQPIFILIAMGLVMMISATRDIKVKGIKIGVLIFIGYILASYTVGTAFFFNGNYNYFLKVQERENSAINWMGQNVPEGEVVAATHSLGWWTAGLAHRPTLAATPLPYVGYPYEVPLVDAASFILTASYQIDNGILQVQESGPFAGWGNPSVALVRRGLHLPAAEIRDNETAILALKSGQLNYIDLAQFPEKNAGLVARATNEMEIAITYKWEGLVITKHVVVRQATRFITIKYQWTSSSEYQVLGVITKLHFPQVNQTNIEENWVGALELLRGIGIAATFEGPPSRIELAPPTAVQIVFTATKSDSSFTIQLGLLDAEGMREDEAMNNLVKLIENPLSQDTRFIDTPVSAHVYTEAVEQYNVRYIAADEPGLIIRFATDARFNSVYSNGRVSIFRVTS